MTIPPYDDELKRLSETQDVSFEKVIDDFFRNIFDVHMSQDFLGFLQILMWIILGTFVLYILYRELGISTKKDTKDTEEIEMTDLGGLGTAADADIRGHNLIKEIQNAVANKDYAEAIHLRYLMTIQQLDIKHRIKWTPSKTPMMYVAELKEGQDILRNITLTFLYIKYGHYPAKEETYNDVTDMFNEICYNKKKGGEE